MEIISYIKWTEPNERKTFERLVTTTSDNTELEEKLTKELKISAIDAKRVILKFRDKIKQLRNQ